MRKPQVLIFASLACLSVLFWSGCSSKEPQLERELENNLAKESIAVEITEAQTGSLSSAQRYVGEILPKTSTLVFPKVPGSLEQLFIQKGELVHKGQVLAKLNTRDFTFAIKEAETRLEEAKARLVQAQATANTSSESQLEPQIKLLELAEANYQRTKSLVEAGALPAAQLEAAEAEWLRAQQNLLTTELAEEKNAAAEAKEEAGIEIARQAVKQAEISLERAKTALQDTQIKAVAKGIVADLIVTVGDQLSPQQTLAKIIDLDSVLVTIHILEQELGLFKQGQQVDVFIPTLSFKAIGKVNYIGLEIDKSTQMYPIEIEIDNPELTLLPGMQAEVQLSQGTQEEGVLLPIQASIEDDEQLFVYVLKGNQVEKRPIRLLDSNQEYMLVQGLHAGEQIVFKAEAPLTDQAHVRVVESTTAH